MYNVLQSGRLHVIIEDADRTTINLNGNTINTYYGDAPFGKIWLFHDVDTETIYQLLKELEMTKLSKEDQELREWVRKIKIIRWKGVDIPYDTAVKHVLRPEEITPSIIMQEPNAEVRRWMIETYGLNDFLLDCGAKVLDDDPKHGKLVQVEIDGDTYHAVIVVNGTPVPQFKPANPREATMFTKDGRRLYALLVENVDNTAHGAVAWTHKKKKQDYDPGIRT